MPLYEFECQDCNAVFEVVCAYGHKPACTECDSKNVNKLVSLCSFKCGPPAEFRKQHEQAKEELALRADLKEKHGVHDIKNLPNSENRDFKQVYKDIKKMGTKVQDSLQETRARNQIETKLKQRAWQEQALKRTPKRRAEAEEKRKKQAFAAKAITVSGK